jgi:hypothetical protein
MKNSERCYLKSAFNLLVYIGARGSEAHKLRATNSEPLIFFPSPHLTFVTVPHNQLTQHKPPTSRRNQLLHHTPPTDRLDPPQLPLRTPNQTPPKHQQKTRQSENETPHPKLPHLRPQSLQTRILSFSSAPPRRRTRTRRPRCKPRVSCQRTASIGLEGY